MTPVVLIGAAAWRLVRPVQPVMRTCCWCGVYKVCYSVMDPVCEECAPDYDDAHAI